MSDDVLVAVTKAIIWRLDASGIAQSFEPGDTRNPNLPLLTAKARPPDPDRIVAVTAHSRRPNPSPYLLDEPIAVQLWIRGTPNDVFDADRISDAAFDALNGQHRVNWGGLHIARCVLDYGGPIGPDDSSRWERSENYLVTLQRSRP